MDVEDTPISQFGASFDSQWEQFQLLLRREGQSLDSETKIRDVQRVASEGLKWISEIDKIANKKNIDRGICIQILILNHIVELLFSI